MEENQPKETQRTKNPIENENAHPSAETPATETDVLPAYREPICMKSKWFQVFDSEQKRLMDEERRKQNTVPTLIFILVVVFGVASLASGADALTIILGLFVPFILIFGFISLMLKLGKQSDPTAGLKLNLERILDTPQDIALFDLEMEAEPKHSIEGSESLKICFTDHFLYTDEKYMGLHHITVARYEELISEKFSKEKSWVSTNPYKFHCYLDFFDDDKKKIISISMEDDSLEALDGLLKEYCPQLALSSRT